MATIYKEFTVDAPVDRVWDALRDFGALDRRLAAGFVTACRLVEPGLRAVTFANGRTVHERLVGLDEEARRVAYTVTDGQASHHNASAQVFPEGPGRTRFVWITDLLPDEFAAPIGGMMDLGLAAMRRTLADAAG